MPREGLTEDEIPSIQPLASAEAFKVKLQHCTVPTQGGMHTILFKKGMSNQKRMFDNVFD